VLVLLLVTLSGVPGSSSGAATENGGAFVAAGRRLVAQCHLTARSIGYPVPCPMRIPRGFTEMAPKHATGCVLHVIGLGGVGGCARSWRGWVVGSSATASQHLAITASPRPLRNPARVVNGPAWYPHARVRQVARVEINGWRMRAVMVPQETNDGSVFANHVVLVWTVGSHTYAVGFHNVRGLRQTLRLDERLARGIQLIRPS
jgi:hypothetical protein